MPTATGWINGQALDFKESRPRNTLQLGRLAKGLFGTFVPFN
jgi:hypothetical protein